MLKRVAFLAVTVIFGMSIAACGNVWAQRALENASEFQQKIVEKEEEQMEDKEASQTPGGDISWDESADSAGSGQADQAGTQGGQGN